MTTNSHGFSATSRTLFQVKNNVFIWDNAYTAIRYKLRCNLDEEYPLLSNGLFFVELLLLNSLNQVADGLRSLRAALFQLGIKVFVW